MLSRSHLCNYISCTVGIFTKTKKLFFKWFFLIAYDISRRIRSLNFKFLYCLILRTQQKLFNESSCCIGLLHLWQRVWNEVSSNSYQILPTKMGKLRKSQTSQAEKTLSQTSSRFVNTSFQRQNLQKWYHQYEQRCLQHLHGISFGWVLILWQKV